MCTIAGVIVELKKSNKTPANCKDIVSLDKLMATYSGLSRQDFRIAWLGSFVFLEACSYIAQYDQYE